jgi:hypothetical protein
MRALVLSVLVTAGCSKSDPPKETAAPAESAKPTVRIAISAAAASATRPFPDAGK